MSPRLQYCLAPVFAALAAAPAISAQATKHDVAGRWLFQTSGFDEGCTMGGTVDFRPTNQRGAYACAFVIETHCTSFGREAEYWRVKESCSAAMKDGQLSIVSKVDQIEETRVGGAPARLPGYTADMFNVKPSADFKEMIGQQSDRTRRTTVRFWRDAERLS